jgi:Fe-S-cluster containining protein
LLKQNRHSKAGERGVGVTLAEAFVLVVYRDLDRDIECEIERLVDSGGSAISCRKGCKYCCLQTIPATLSEAHAIAQFTKRTFAPGALAVLREKIGAWLRWEGEELPALVEPGITDVNAAVHLYGPPCPLLLDGECGVYSVRPVACRAHFVTSNPGRCMPRTLPGALDGQPQVVESVHLVATVHALLIRKFGGADDAKPLSILVHGLAAELV